MKIMQNSPPEADPTMVEKFKIQNSRKTFGFTLVESLVAITIILVSVVGPLTVIAKTLAFARFARDEITAFYLAQDALEYVHNTRDNNAIAGANWLSGLSSCVGGSCMVDTVANTVASCTPACSSLKLSSAGAYGYVSGVTTPFVRGVTITEVSGSREATVDVVVTWSEGVLSRNFSLRGYLYNWQ